MEISNPQAPRAALYKFRWAFNGLFSYNRWKSQICKPLGPNYVNLDGLLTGLFSYKLLWDFRYKSQIPSSEFYPPIAFFSKTMLFPVSFFKKYKNGGGRIAYA